LPPKLYQDIKGAVVGFSRDGKTIASAGADGMIKLWNSDDGSLLHTLSGHSKVVSAVAFSPNDQVIASASYDGTVKLWQKDGKLLKTLSGHEGAVVRLLSAPTVRPLLQVIRIKL
jgi:WD40 repeat protein